MTLPEPRERVDAADGDARREVERTGDRRARVLADQRDGHVLRVDVGDSERQRALDDRRLLQLHARAGVDRGHDVHPDRPGHQVDQAAEDVGNVLLCLLHVEHEVRRLARAVRLRVVRAGAAGGERLAVEERRHPCSAAADLGVVGARRVACILRCLVLDRCVRSRRLRRIEAVAEVGAACERGCVRLHLQVPVVGEPVADVDREAEDEQERGQEQGEEDEDAAALTAQM